MQTFKVYSFGNSQILFQIAPESRFIKVTTYYGAVESIATLMFNNAKEATTAFTRIDKKMALRFRRIMDRGFGYEELNDAVDKLEEDWADKPKKPIYNGFPLYQKDG